MIVRSMYSMAFFCILFFMQKSTSFKFAGSSKLKCRPVFSAVKRFLVDETRTSITPRTLRAPQWKSLEAALDEGDGLRVENILEELKQAGQAPLWNSVRMFYQRYSLLEMQVATGIRGDILEKLGLNGNRDINRTAYILGGLVVFSFITFFGFIPYLPGSDYGRFVASWITTFVPYGFLILAIAKPKLLQQWLVYVLSINPLYKERLIRHEAGHFLLGYLCGLPIESYRVDSVTNAVAFFPSNIVNINQSGIPEETLLKLSIVSLGGIIAECLKFGDSEGGYADLKQLNDLLRQSKEKLTDKEQQDRVRFAAVMAHTYLKMHPDTFERLAACIQRGASVVDCIRVIEEN